jgi:ABC-2 type transport system permease protein
LNLKRVKDDFVIYGKGNVRGVTGLVLTLVLPIVFLLLFGAIFAGAGIVGGTLTMGSSRMTVYVQNQDAGPVGQSFISALNSTNTTNIVVVSDSQNLQQYLSSHSSSDGIVIPKNFSTSYQAGTHVNVTIYGDPTSPSSAVISGVVTSIINGFNLQRAGGTAVLGASRLTVTSQSYKYIDFLVPGLIGYSILASPMFAMVNVSSQYKHDKIFKQLSLTPLTKAEWLLSKNLWYIVLTMISFLLMVPIGSMLFGAHITLSLGLFAFLTIGPFLFVSLGMLIGTLSNSVESAALVGNLITFPMMFLSGTFFPLAAMPGYLQTAAHVLPLYYVIDGLTNLMLYSNVTQALVDIGVLAGTSIAVFGLAVKFFKWRED